jgi:hypothetical protein
MSSTFIKTAAVVCALATMLALGAVAQAAPPQNLARLGERSVSTDPAILARHRALGRLDYASTSAKDLGSSGSFAWPRTALELFGAIGLILLAAGYVRARRLRIGGAS